REMRHNVHSKLMCWLALRRGQHLSRLFGEPELEQSCADLANVIRTDILRNGMDPARKHFVGIYGGNEPDASLLLLPIVGCFRATDPFILRTIDWLRRELGAGPFLRRYRMD